MNRYRRNRMGSARRWQSKYETTMMKISRCGDLGWNGSSSSKFQIAKSTIRRTTTEASRANSRVQYLDRTARLRAEVPLDVALDCIAGTRSAFGAGRLHGVEERGDGRGKDAETAPHVVQGGYVGAIGLAAHRG